MPGTPASQGRLWGYCPAWGSSLAHKNAVPTPKPCSECLYLHNFVGPDTGVELQTLHLGNVGAQAAVLPCGEQTSEQPLILLGNQHPNHTCTSASTLSARADPAHTHWKPPVPTGEVYWPAHCLQMTTHKLMDAQSGL